MPQLPKLDWMIKAMISSPMKNNRNLVLSIAPPLYTLVVFPFYRLRNMIAVIRGYASMLAQDCWTVAVGNSDRGPKGKSRYDLFYCPAIAELIEIRTTR